MSKDLSIFLEKIRKKKSNTKHKVIMDTKEMGEVEFVRPSTSDILDFMDKTNGEVDSSNKKMLEAIYEFLYLHCPIIQKKEVREEYNLANVFYLVPEIFGFDETSNIMEKFMDAFGIAEAETEVDKDIKK